jgi:hypothetical protein
MGGAGGESLPLRPLTVGEVLDAATNLLRRYASQLLIAALVLAMLEQLALYPLRLTAHVAPPWYYPPHIDRLGAYWLMLAAGLGTESVILTLLGGLAARAALGDLLGRAPGRLVGKATRPVPLLLLALLTGSAAFLGAAAAILPWLLWYVYTGLAAPALVIDRRPPRTPVVPPGAPGPGAPVPVPGPASGPWAAPGQPASPARYVPLGPFGALGRAMSLVNRSGWRPGGIRLVGYLAWWVIRLALGAGTWSLVSVFLRDNSPFNGGTVSGWAWLAGMATWTVVNALAYAALGCLDAVLHLDTRMRVEGLDIALSRALRTNRPPEPALAVPR